MIIAHNDDINRQFHRMFERHEIRKAYRAIVKGLVEQPKFSVNEEIDGKSACTRFELIAEDRNSGRSLLRIRPESGRKHQIRKHLKSVGLAVVNDRLYGTPPHVGDMKLQATALSFVSPINGQQIDAHIPRELLLTL